MTQITYEQYTSNTLSDNPLKKDEFRRYREQAYLILELASDMDFSEWTPSLPKYGLLLSKAIVYQIDYLQTNGLDIGTDSATSGQSYAVGKVSVGSGTLTSTSPLSKRLSPLALEILTSLGFMNRSAFVKENIY